MNVYNKVHMRNVSYGFEKQSGNQGNKDMGRTRDGKTIKAIV